MSDIFSPPAGVERTRSSSVVATDLHRKTGARASRCFDGVEDEPRRAHLTTRGEILTGFRSKILTVKCNRAVSLAVQTSGEVKVNALIDDD